MRAPMLPPQTRGDLPLDLEVRWARELTASELTIICYLACLCLYQRQPAIRCTLAHLAAGPPLGGHSKDRGTRLSRTRIWAALKRLERRGAIRMGPEPENAGPPGRLYEINFAWQGTPRPEAVTPEPGT